MLFGVFFPFNIQNLTFLKQQWTPAASQANLMAKNRASVSIFPVNKAMLALFTYATASSQFCLTCVYDGRLNDGTCLGQRRMQAASFAVSLLTLRRQVHFAGRVFMRGRLNDGIFLKQQGRQQLCKQISLLIVLQRQVYFVSLLEIVI